MANQQQASEEQVMYASILEKGMYVGLAALVITFAVYMLQITPSVIPVDQISKYWGMNVHKYLDTINAQFLQLPHPPTGWAWLGLLGKSDFLNFVGVAILSGITVLCYISIVPIFLKKGDTAYAAMAAITAAVLALAASGILAVGGH